MKVLFLKHVVHVAKPGEVKDVKPGYALNSLIPQGLAKKLTPELEKQLKNQAKKDDKNRIALSSEKTEIIDALEGHKFDFKLKVEGEKVFGSVTEKDIALVVSKFIGVTLTKKYIILSSGHIKTLGNHVAHVKLGKHHSARIIISIIPQ